MDVEEGFRSQPSLHGHLLVHPILHQVYIDKMTTVPADLSSDQ